MEVVVTGTPITDEELNDGFVVTFCVGHATPIFAVLIPSAAQDAADNVTTDNQRGKPDSLPCTTTARFQSDAHCHGYHRKTTK
ncbi:hypothetical protein MRX96_048186 [Rhipicephalus microplus]